MTATSSPASSSTAESLEIEMKRIENSNDPNDIATLAYIWGYPLVSVDRLADYNTSPNAPPGPFRAPLNTFYHATDSC